MDEGYRGNELVVRVGCFGGGETRSRARGVREKRSGVSRQGVERSNNENFIG